MLRTVRSISRSFYYWLESRFALGMSLVTIIQTLRRFESQFAVNVAGIRLGTRTSNLKRLSAALFPDHEKKLFIIGKGPSRRILSRTQQAEIASNYSISINDAHLSDVIPTLELREQGRIDFQPADRPHTQCPERLAAKVPILSHITVGLGSKNRTVLDPIIASSERSRTSFYSSVNLMTANVEIAAKVFVTSASKQNLFSRSVVVGAQASVLRALWLAIHSGCREIILVGIDLSNAPEGANSPIVRHATAEISSGYFLSVVDLIPRIHALLDSETDVALRLGSKSGLLATELPLHSWT